MSWLEPSATGRDDLLDLHPGLAATHRRVVEEIWDGTVDPRILELCRLRSATLVGNRAAWLEPMTPAAEAAGLTAELVDALPRWPNDSRFDGATRACLSLAEQFVIDVHGVTDALVAEVSSHIGPDGVIHLTTALAMWEIINRFDTTLLGEPVHEGAPTDPVARQPTTTQEA